MGSIQGDEHMKGGCAKLRLAANPAKFFRD
jgi:hypothetical protein